MSEVEAVLDALADVPDGVSDEELHDLFVAATKEYARAVPNIHEPSAHYRIRMQTFQTLLHGDYDASQLPEL